MKFAIILFSIGRIYEAILGYLYSSIKLFDGEAYVFGAVVSFLFCLIISNLASLPFKGKPAQVIINFILFFFYSFLLSTNFYTLKEFEEFISADMIQFVIDSPHYITAYAKTYLMFTTISILCASTLALIFIFNRFNKPTSGRKLGISLIVSAVLILGLLNHINVTQKQFYLSQEASTLLAIRNSVLKKGNIKRLYRSKSRIGPDLLTSPKILEKKPNILLIINESWGKSHLKSYNPLASGLSRTSEILEKINGPLQILQKAYTNSTATELSLPSILTGVAPYEPIGKLHRMPFIWDWAKAAGYQTAFLTSQSLNWANFDLFFNSNGLDRRITADNTDLTIINDCGVDDYKFLRSVAESLIFESSGPKFIVFFSNALHIPFQTKSEAPERNEFTTRYEKALDILDQSLSLFIKKIADESPNGLKVVLTSDHGENSTPGHTARINNFFPDIINIPTIFSGFEELKGIQKNSENIDILPTIIHSLGLCKNNLKICHGLSGRNLLESSKTDPTIISLNTNDYRDWDNKAFAIVHGNNHFIYNNKKGTFLFNTKDDAILENNLWPKTDQTFWRQTIESNNMLKKIINSN